jgi:hypothetical protein
MFDELNKYKNKGHFFFQRDSNLKDVSKDVPNLPGVYCIYRLHNGKIDLVYIGKSGTICSNGTFKDQLLKKRLNNKQEGIPRQKFFEQKLTEEGSDTLNIYWYVTFDEENRDLPSYVEGILLQRYFEIYGRIPEWNRKC